MAFWTLLTAAFTRRPCASIFSDTARPAASSDGLTILEPEERRVKERPSISWLWLRLRAAAMAWMLVLITLMVAVVVGLFVTLRGGFGRTRWVFGTTIHGGTNGAD